MNFLKSENFEFEGNTYTIRVVEHDGGLLVRAFLGEKAANGYSYVVDMATRFDLQTSLQISAADHLIELAGADIKNKTWEQYFTSVKSLQQNK
jgi:hypothetical protein